MAAVTGDLLSIGVPAFWTEPLGHVPLAAKLATNTVLLALVLAVALVGLRRARRPASESAIPGPPGRSA